VGPDSIWPVLMLTALAGHQAPGFVASMPAPTTTLSKPFAMEELLARIRALHGASPVYREPCAPAAGFLTFSIQLKAASGVEEALGTQRRRFVLPRNQA